MSYQCKRCSGWTADGFSHSCVYDELKESRSKNVELIERLKKLEAEVRVLNKRIKASWSAKDGETDRANRLSEAFEYLVSRLPKEETAGFVTHARAIVGGNKEEIERTR
jgi:hypothetical protein